jgi:glutaconyl-CoA decarboxylase
MSAATYDGNIRAGGEQWSVSVNTEPGGDGDVSVRHVVTCSGTYGETGTPATVAALSAAVQRFLSRQSASGTRGGQGIDSERWRTVSRLDAVGMDGFHRLRLQARKRSMTTYRVTIDGRGYDVTVEEISGDHVASGVARPPKAGRSGAPVSEGRHAGERAVRAPMPGKVLAVAVGQAATVDTDTVLLVLEAMKMENDILAPGEGTVKAVHVRAGDTVNTGDVMMVIE